MAKLERITGKIFGATASSSGDNPDIGQFGSAKAGTYNGTGDVAEIQSLPAWDNGWIDAVTPTQQFPTLPEMTGVHKVLSYQNAYLLKEGMPEYDPGTIYDIGGMCKIDKITYYCTLNNNTNDPRTLNGWIVYYDPDATASNLIPFCVNSGSVNSNGDGNCLTLPSGSTTVVTRTFVRPNLTADGTMGGDSFAVTASSAYDYPAWMAFDDSNLTYWGTSNQSSGTQSITFYNPAPLNVTQLNVIVFGITNAVSTYNDNINVYGSNDNSTWTQLASNIPSGSYGTYQSKLVPIDLSSNTNSYNYYKIENTSCEYSSPHGYVWAIANVDITATYQETITSSENLILEGHTVPVVLTNAKGLTSVINEDLTEDVSSGYADGEYNVFVNNGELELYNNTIYRNKHLPTDGNAFVQPTLNANGTMGGSSFAVSADSERDGHSAYYAVDGNPTYNNGWYSSETTSGSWFAFYNPTPLRVTSITITNYMTDGYIYCSTAGKIQISDDGTTWEDIKTYANSSTAGDLTWTIDLSDNINYSKYYRIYSTQNANSNGWIIRELAISAIEQVNLTNNTIWLDTSVRPLTAYKYNGSIWEEYSGVPVGTCTVENNQVTEVKTFPYNYTEKFLVSDAGYPSDRYIDLTLGASGATYTAPTDGYFQFNATTEAQPNFIYMATSIIATQDSNNGTGVNVHTFIPVRKNDVMTIGYSNVGYGTLYFVYAEGCKEENE